VGKNVLVLILSTHRRVFGNVIDYFFKGNGAPLSLSSTKILRFLQSFLVNI